MTPTTNAHASSSSNVQNLAHALRASAEIDAELCVIAEGINQLKDLAKSLSESLDDMDETLASSTDDTRQLRTWAQWAGCARWARLKAT